MVNSHRKPKTSEAEENVFDMLTRELGCWFDEVSAFAKTFRSQQKEFNAATKGQKNELADKWLASIGKYRQGLFEIKHSDLFGQAVFELNYCDKAVLAQKLNDGFSRIKNAFSDYFPSRDKLERIIETESRLQCGYFPLSFNFDCQAASTVDLLKRLATKTAEALKPADDKAGDTPVTLREFMRVYCESLTGKFLDSRVEALQRLARRKGKEIKLKHTGRWKRGKPKYFLPSYLTENWPAYQKRLPTLPNLKRPSLSSK